MRHVHQYEACTSTFSNVMFNNYLDIPQILSIIPNIVSLQIHTNVTNMTFNNLYHYQPSPSIVNIYM